MRDYRDSGVGDLFLWDLLGRWCGYRLDVDYRGKSFELVVYGRVSTSKLALYFLERIETMFQDPCVTNCRLFSVIRRTDAEQVHRNESRCE